MKKRPEPIVRWLGTYKGFKIEQAATRIGSMRILSMPSRILNTLYYPDGRVIKNS